MREKFLSPLKKMEPEDECDLEPTFQFSLTNHVDFQQKETPADNQDESKVSLLPLPTEKSTSLNATSFANIVKMKTHVHKKAIEATHINAEAHDKMMESKELMIEYVHAQNENYRIENNHLKKLLQLSEGSLNKVRKALARDDSMLHSSKAQNYIKLGIMTQFQMAETRMCLRQFAMHITSYISADDLNLYCIHEGPDAYFLEKFDLESDAETFERTPIPLSDSSHPLALVGRNEMEVNMFHDESAGFVCIVAGKDASGKTVGVAEVISYSSELDSHNLIFLQTFVSPMFMMAESLRQSSKMMDAHDSTVSTSQNVDLHDMSVTGGDSAWESPLSSRSDARTIPPIHFTPMKANSKRVTSLGSPHSSNLGKTPASSHMNSYDELNLVAEHLPYICNAEYVVLYSVSENAGLRLLSNVNHSRSIISFFDELAARALRQRSTVYIGLRDRVPQPHNHEEVIHLLRGLDAHEAFAILISTTNGSQLVVCGLNIADFIEFDLQFEEHIMKYFSRFDKHLHFSNNQEAAFTNNRQGFSNILWKENRILKRRLHRFGDLRAKSTVESVKEKETTLMDLRQQLDHVNQAKELMEHDTHEFSLLQTQSERLNESIAGIEFGGINYGKNLMDMCAYYMSALNLEEVLATAVNDACDLTSALHCKIFFTSLGSHSKYTFGQFTPGGYIVNEEIEPNSLVYQAVEEGRSNRYSIYEESGHTDIGWSFDGYQSKCAICCPIFETNSRKIVAVCLVSGHDEGGAFGEDDEYLLSQLCTFIGAAIVRVKDTKKLQQIQQLYSEVLGSENAWRTFERKVREISAVNDIFELFSSNFNKMYPQMEAALYLFDRSKQHGELYTWDKKSSNKAYIPFGKDDFYRNRKVIKMRDKLNPKKVESAMDIVVEAYFPIQSHDGVFFGVFHIIQKKNDASYKQLRRTVLSEEGENEIHFGSEIIVSFTSRMQMLADTIATGLEMFHSKYATNQLKQHIEAFTALSKLSSIEHVLTETIQRARTIVSADRGSLFMYSKESNELYSTVAEGVEGELRFDANGTLAGLVASSGNVLNLHNAYDHPMFNPKYDRETKYRTKEMLCVPVYSRDGQVVAVLQLINKTSGVAGFSQEDVDLINALSVSVGSAIESINSTARQDEQIENSKQELLQMNAQIKALEEDVGGASQSSSRAFKLVELTHALSHHNDIDALILHVIEGACDLLEADRATLYLIDTETNELWSKVAMGADTIRIPMSHGIVGHVYTTKAVLNVANAHEDARFDKSIDMKTGYQTKSVLCMPVMEKKSNKCIGVIEVMNKLTAPNKFMESDESLLAAFSCHIAAAALVCMTSTATQESLKESIGNLRALETELEEFKRAEHTVGSKKRDVLEFSKHLQASHEMDSIIVRVVEKSKGLVSADRASLFIVDYDENILWSKFANKEDRITIPLHSGIVGSVVSSGKARRIDDAYAEPDFNRSVDHKTGYRTKAIMCVPIQDISGRVIAALQVINKVSARDSEAETETVFSDADLDLLTELGEHVSMAVSQSLLHTTKSAEIEKTVSHLKTLEAQLAEEKTSSASVQQRTKTMLEMTCSLMMHREIEHVFEGVMANTRKLLNADRATLFLVDAETKELYSYVSRTVPEIRIPLSAGIVGYCATHKEVVRVADAHDDYRFDKDIDVQTHYRTRSVLCVPVMSENGVVLGVIQALNKFCVEEDSEVERHIEFVDEDVSTLQSWSTQVSLAIINVQDFQSKQTHAMTKEEETSSLKRALEDARKKILQLQNMIAAGQHMSALKDINALIAASVSAAKESIHADRCSLFMYSKESNELYSTVAEGVEGELRFDANGTLAGLVASSGNVLNLHNAYDHPMFNPKYDRETKYRTKEMLCVPVYSRDGQVVAVLQLINKTSGVAGFSQEDVDLINALSVSVGSAIESINSTARQDEQIENSKQELLQMNAQIKALEEDVGGASQSSSRAFKLVELTHALSHHNDIDALILHVIEGACDLLEADRATLYLIDTETNELWSKVAMGADTIRIPMSHGIVGHVYTTKAVLNVANAHEDARFDKSIDMKTGYQTKSVLCMPVMEKKSNKCIGVIEVMNKLTAPNKFMESDESLLAAFSCHIAAAALVCMTSTATQESLKESIGNLRALETELEEFKRAEHTVGSKKRDVLEFSKHLQASHEMDSIIVRVVEKSKGLVSADRASLFIVDYDENILWSKFANKEDRITIPLHSGIVGSVVSSGKARRIDDAYAEPDFNRSVDHKTGYRTKAIMCVPIQDISGRVIAALQVINKVSARDSEAETETVFSDADLDLLTELGEHVSMAVSQSLLHTTKSAEIEKTVSHLKTLEAQLAEEKTSSASVQQRTKTMLEMTCSLMMHREIEHVFEGVMANTRKLLNADRATLFLVDAETKELYSYVSRTVPEIRIPLSAGIVGYCATHKEVVRVADAHDDYRFDKDIDVQTHYRTRSVLCVPVMSENGVVLGVIQALNKMGANKASHVNTERYVELIDVEFSYEDIEVMKSFCSQVAAATLNCYALETEMVERRNLERTLGYLKDRLGVSDKEKVLHTSISEKRLSLLSCLAGISTRTSISLSCRKFETELRTIFNCKHSFLYIFDPSRSQFYRFRHGDERTYTSLTKKQLQLWQTSVILNLRDQQFQHEVLESIETSCSEEFKTMLFIPCNVVHPLCDMILILGNKVIESFSDVDELESSLASKVFAVCLGRNILTNMVDSINRKVLYALEHQKRLFAEEPTVKENVDELPREHLDTTESHNRTISSPAKKRQHHPSIPSHIVVSPKRMAKPRKVSVRKVHLEKSVEDESSVTSNIALLVEQWENRESALKVLVTETSLQLQKSNEMEQAWQDKVNVANDRIANLGKEIEEAHGKWKLTEENLRDKLSDMKNRLDNKKLEKEKILQEQTWSLKECEKLKIKLNEAENLITTLKLQREEETKAKLDSQGKLKEAKNKCKSDIEAMQQRFEKVSTKDQARAVSPRRHQQLQALNLKTTREYEKLATKLQKCRSVVYQLIGLNKLELDQFSALEQLHSPEKKEQRTSLSTEKEEFLQSFLSGDETFDNGGGIM